MPVNNLGSPFPHAPDTPPAVPFWYQYQTGPPPPPNSPNDSSTAHSEPTQVYSASQNLQDAFKDSDASADIPTQGVASMSAPDNSYNADEDFCNLAVPNNHSGPAGMHYQIELVQPAYHSAHLSGDPFAPATQHFAYVSDGDVSDSEVLGAPLDLYGDNPHGNSELYPGFTLNDHRDIVNQLTAADFVCTRLQSQCSAACPHSHQDENGRVHRPAEQTAASSAAAAEFSETSSATVASEVQPVEIQPVDTQSDDEDKENIAPAVLPANN